jgi:hypothetical protein
MGSRCTALRTSLNIGPVLACLVALPLAARGELAEPPTGDTGQPVAMYKLEDAWAGQNLDERSLQEDFELVKADPARQGYDVRSTADLGAGIPATTRIIILPGNGVPSAQQTRDVNAPAAQANLAAFVEGGGCLLANLGDRLPGDGYLIPGLSGKADDELNCTGTRITEAGLSHPITLGPDGAPGGGDDLTQDGVDAGKAGSYGGIDFCYDNHGSLDGILPPGATVIWTEEGGLERPTLAEYALGAGRVAVLTRPLGFGSDPPQVMVNVLNDILSCGNRGPVCAAASASPARLWPPDRTLRDVSIDGVADADGDPVEITVDAVFQDEPVLGHGDDETASDASGVGTSTPRVRAQRSGTKGRPGDGRVYHVAFSADDGQGGRCQGSVRVCVPHDRRADAACVDGGPLYDSIP